MPVTEPGALPASMSEFCPADLPMLSLLRQNPPLGLSTVQSGWLGLLVMGVAVTQLMYCSPHISKEKVPSQDALLPLY